MAEAVISRPGPQEPEKGLPGPDEDNRSAERGSTSHGPGRCPLVETRERSIGRDPRGTIVAILRGACLYFPPFVRVSVSLCNRLPRLIKNGVDSQLIIEVTTAGLLIERRPAAPITVSGT